MDQKPPAADDIQTYLGSSFSMPALSPELTPPPFRYANNRMINVLFIADPQLIVKMVAPPLKLDPSEPLLFYIGKLNLPEYQITYNEAALAAPIIDQNGQAGYYPLVLYLDKTNPIIGGREIYGYPKKEADFITFEENNGVIAAAVTRYGIPIVTLRFETRESIRPIPPRTIAPWYLLKYIPSAARGAAPDVLKLVKLGFDPYTLSAMSTGAATLKFGASPYDSFLAQIPTGDIVYSEAITSDFTMGYGEVALDYLAK